jgi:hypothetical protein
MYIHSKYDNSTVLRWYSFTFRYTGTSVNRYWYKYKNDLQHFLVKGSLQWEPRGVRKVAYIRHRSQTVAIEVFLPSNFAVVFDFTYFCIHPSKSKWIGNVLPNRQNAAIRSMFFSSFIMRIAYWCNESFCVLRQGAANCKKSPRNTNWKLKTLQFCCALPNGARGIVASI